MTFKDKVISAAVRFGCKGSFVDNTAKGGVAVSLDIETGMLESYGMREYDLNHYTEHPDSHLKFENTIVTQWPAVKKLVTRVRDKDCVKNRVKRAKIVRFTLC